jgi:hypothetical protein
LAEATIDSIMMIAGAFMAWATSGLLSGGFSI